VLLLRADRPQAVPILGWGPEFLDTREWRELYSGLQTTLPPCIVVDEYARSIIRSRYPAIIEFIESRYEVAFIGESGTWYVLRQGGPATRKRCVDHAMQDAGRVVTPCVDQPDFLPLIP
jgi:hypothetical protein